MSDLSTHQKAGRSFRRHAVKIVIVVGALCALAAIKAMPPKDTTVSPAEKKPVNVAVLTLTAEPNVPDTFDLPATVEPNQVVRISAEVAGRIERIGPEKGQQVHAGDLLIQINADLLEPQKASAAAQLQRDRIEYERMKELVSKQATAKRDLDDAATRLQVSQAALDEISARVDRTRISAPCSGILNELPVEEGEYVDPGNPVASLVDIDTVKVVVDVPERDIAFFGLGETARIVTDIRGETRMWSGRITFISALADERTRSTRMEITLPNPDRALHSGQIVKVRLTRRRLKDALFVPLLAVIPMERGNAVYVAEGDAAQRREVELGIIKGDRVQILRGLAPGDRLIVAGHRLVASGEKVKIESEKN